MAGGYFGTCPLSVGSTITQKRGSDVAKNPVEYAEQKLAVHELYERAEDHLAQYEQARAELSSVGASLRFAREELADFEADLAVTTRAENPDMSATAFDRMFRVLLQQNEDHRELQRVIFRLQGDYDLAENAVKLLDRKLEVSVGRLHEVAGLLQFYAARSPRPT